MLLQPVRHLVPPLLVLVAKRLERVKVAAVVEDVAMAAAPRSRDSSLLVVGGHLLSRPRLAAFVVLLAHCCFHFVLVRRLFAACTSLMKMPCRLSAHSILRA